jgi:dynein heavy chain
LHSSTIEGINVFAQKFTSFYDKVSSEKYDPLDFRKGDFDPDYNEFKKNVINTELELRKFFYQSISNLPNIQQTLVMLNRYLILLSK